MPIAKTGHRLGSKEQLRALNNKLPESNIHTEDEESDMEVSDASDDAITYQGIVVIR